jgi:hypothetical protein
MCRRRAAPAARAHGVKAAGPSAAVFECHGRSMTAATVSRNARLLVLELETLDAERGGSSAAEQSETCEFANRVLS